MFKPEIRECQRIAFCRSCDKEINKSEKMLSWYSYRNKGMHIHICMDCVGKISNLFIKGTYQSKDTNV